MSYSKYSGVAWDEDIDAWVATCSHQGTTIVLGSFDSVEAAGLKYDEFALAHGLPMNRPLRFFGPPEVEATDREPSSTTAVGVLPSFAPLSGDAASSTEGASFCGGENKGVKGPARQRKLVPLDDDQDDEGSDEDPEVEVEASKYAMIEDATFSLSRCEAYSGRGHSFERAREPTKVWIPNGSFDRPTLFLELPFNLAVLYSSFQQRDSGVSASPPASPPPVIPMDVAAPDPTFKGPSNVTTSSRKGLPVELLAYDGITVCCIALSRQESRGVLKHCTSTPQ